MSRSAFGRAGGEHDTKSFGQKEVGGKGEKHHGQDVCLQQVEDHMPQGGRGEGSSACHQTEGTACHRCMFRGVS